MVKSIVIGNIGADAVVRHHNGNQAISFSVAHNEKYKDAQGVAHEKTLWVNCTLWRTKETALTNFLKRGQLVYVEGTPSVSVYRSTKTGEPAADFSLRVTNIQLLGGKSESDDQPAENQKQPQATPVEEMATPDWAR